MNLNKLLSAERVVDLEARDKAGALRELCGVMATSKGVKDAKAFQKAVEAREAVLSTGIGLGLAVPHAKVAAVREFTVAVGRARKGIPWDSLDGQPVTLVVMIGANDRQAVEYTQVLAAVVGRVKDAGLRKKIAAASKPAEVYSLLVE